MSAVTRYCLDTNAVSDIINDKYCVNQRLKDEIRKGSKIFITSITYYEIVRGLKESRFHKKLKLFQEIYETFPHIYLDRESMEVIDKATEIYDQLHKGKQIEDNDIYIAAMAIVNNCILVSDNEKHFGRIKELRLVNWRNN